jgi:hypothetical protein
VVKKRFNIKIPKVSVCNTNLTKDKPDNNTQRAEGGYKNCWSKRICNKVCNLSNNHYMRNHTKGDILRTISDYQMVISNHNSRTRNQLPLLNLTRTRKLNQFLKLPNDKRYQLKEKILLTLS